MKAVNPPSRARRIIGDILLVLAILLFADVVIVMLHKINAVVLKADYQEIFQYQIILCTILLLFALDVRFSLFTRWKPTAVRIAGWALRVIVVVLTMVILFFCGKVICGSMINNSGQADHAIVLGLALENGKPTGDLLARLNTAQTYLEKYPEAGMILIVTSDYHVPRALALAKDLGYEATGLGSPCKPEYWIKNHAREALAWCKYWGVKYLHLPLE